MSKLPLAALLAAPYSGATLLSILLNRHSQISCGGEMFPFTRDSTGSAISPDCSCGKRQIDCEYYRTVAMHMMNTDGISWNRDLFIHTPQYSHNRFLQRILSAGWSYRKWYAFRSAACRVVPAFRNTERMFVDAHVRLMENCLHWKAATLYVDGTKVFPRAELFARSAQFQMKAIHLVRDGRAYCNSYIKNRKLGKEAVAGAARTWVKHIRETEMFHARFPEISILEMRYEDVCRDFPGSMHAICEFLAVPWEEGFQKRNNLPCHMRGNRMLTKFDGTIIEDNSWKEQLSLKEIARINAVARSELQRFNYEISHDMRSYTTL